MKKKVYSLILFAIAFAVFVGCEKEDNEDENQDTPNPVATTVTDVDGNVYNTITIGTQVWMDQNLKVTKFNDGTPISLVTDNTSWSNLTGAAYCWYENDYPLNGSQYGALYNGYAVNSGNLCPNGWHVATEADWLTLGNYLGGLSIAGGKLKETGLVHWDSPNTATNEVGFTALGGGYRLSTTGNFNFIKGTGIWWTTTAVNATTYKTMTMYAANNDLTPGQFGVRNGISVRCVKD